MSRTSTLAVNLILIESRVSAMREPSYLPFLFGGSSHESDKPKGLFFEAKE